MALSESDTPGNSLRVGPSDQDVRSTISAILLREGLVDKTDIDRSARLVGKIDNITTLFQFLEKVGKITRREMLECIRKHRPDLPIGCLLVELGMLNNDQLQHALLLQNKENYRRKIGDVLISQSIISEQDFTRVLASQLGFQFENLDIEQCNSLLIQKYTLKTLKTFKFLPIRIANESTIVAFTDPTNQESRTEVARSLGSRLISVMVSESAFNNALATLSRQQEVFDTKETRTVEKSSTSENVNQILSTAIAEGASDIHIEPLSNRIRIRLRIDGVLREQQELSLEDLPSLVSRIKIMAEADITERHRHQDGQINYTDSKTGITTDFRASFYVTVHGESIVLRISNQNSEIAKLSDIGMPPPILERFTREVLEAPSGVVIIAGPTGSGKTSTLYSCINQLNDENTSIVTAEDPVEIHVDGVCQCDVSPKLGRTFEDSMRQIARQDPDVIVLGELLDPSAAKCAIQAALTGHKVLTTFHSEDSIGVLLSLLNMNIEAFLISSTVVGVVAQRLLRKVCSDCAEPVEADPVDLQVLGWTTEDLSNAQFVVGQGCSSCHFSGYHGRVAVFESLILNESVREAILDHQSSAEIRRTSIETSDMVTMLEDGLVKASQGATTLAEVRRTLPRLSKPRPLQDLRRLTGLPV